ncbi:MAG TPA: hypothetical protein VIX82_15885, partial [Solirubrobacteraceae bacterium]
GASKTREARSLAEYLLAATRQSWKQEPRPLPVVLVEAWYALHARRPVRGDSLPLGPTWGELHPGHLLFEEMERSELARATSGLRLRRH